jgi:hypothetical protein
MISEKSVRARLFSTHSILKIKANQRLLLIELKQDEAAQELSFLKRRSLPAAEEKLRSNFMLITEAVK